MKTDINKVIEDDIEMYVDRFAKLIERSSNIQRTQKTRQLIKKNLFTIYTKGLESGANSAVDYIHEHILVNDWRTVDFTKLLIKARTHYKDKEK